MNGRTLGDVKSVQLSELGAVAEVVKSGEIIEIREGDRVVATVVPLNQARLEARVRELAAQGLVRLGSGEPWPDDFLNESLPGAGAGVLGQLLEDRDDVSRHSD